MLDGRRLGWADFSGNNRLDSFQNLVTNASVALLFLIPGLDETLRINGDAELVTDPDLCQRFAIDGRPARVVVVVTVAEAYIHCAKALRRAGLWSAESWLDASQLPSRRASSRITPTSTPTSRRSKRPASGTCRRRSGSRAGTTSTTGRSEPTSTAQEAESGARF